MEKNILRVDCDCETLDDVIKLMFTRLSYMEDLQLFPFKRIDKIIVGKKNTYNVKIYLNINLDEKFIVIMQLALGSDYRKELNTMANHFILGLDYSNRMFDVKRYPKGQIKFATKTDITEIIRNLIFDSTRKKQRN